ncbi:MAG: hypothetical protein ABI791_07645 [Acidobacteriota bacterium]
MGRTGSGLRFCDSGVMIFLRRAVRSGEGNVRGLPADRSRRSCIEGKNIAKSQA